LARLLAHDVIPPVFVLFLQAFAGPVRSFALTGGVVFGSRKKAIRAGAFGWRLRTQPIAYSLLVI